MQGISRVQPDEGAAALSNEMPMPRPNVGTSPSLLQIFWERRWVLILTTVVTVAAAFIYLLRATPIYTSSSRIYVERQGPKVFTESSEGVRDSDNYLYTQAELIGSITNLMHAVDHIDVQQMKTFKGIDNPAGWLSKQVEVVVGKKDDLITVSCDSPYPQEAAKIVNAVVDAYVSQQSSLHKSTAMEVLKILEDQKEKQGSALNEKLKELVAFRQSNGLLFFEHDKTNIVFERLATLSSTLTKDQIDAVDFQSQYEEAKKAESDPELVRELMLNLVSNDHDSPWTREQERIHSQIDQLSDKLVKLSQDVTLDHPAAKAVQQQAADLKQQLADQQKRMATVLVEEAERQWLAAKQRLASMQAMFDEQQKLAQEVNSKGAELALLQSEVDRLQRTTELLDTRIKEVNVNENTGALNINIVDVAKAAEKASKPAKPRILGLAMALGIMLGAAGALLQDWMDQRLRSAEEIQSLLDVSILGVVPSMPSSRSAVHAQMVRVDPSSEVAEAYRTIRTAIYFGMSAAGRARTILMTSPAPGDGKTTSACNLALAMAQAGRRVLLLEADFRRPRLHKVFEVDGAVGVTNVLAGQIPVEQAIKHTLEDKLDLMVCGPIPPNPSEIINSAPFHAFLEDLITRYDHVIIDSPPVAPVTDARILGALCDVTILVLRADKSTRKLSAHTRDALVAVGSTILGVIVNGVSKSGGAYGGYGKYGHYRYGYSATDGKNGNGTGRRVEVNGQKVLVENNP